MGNGCVAGDFGAGERREEGAAPKAFGAVTDEQRSSSAKKKQPSGRNSDGPLDALLLSLRTRGYAPSSRLASNPPELRALILRLRDGFLGIARPRCEMADGHMKTTVIFTKVSKYCYNVSVANF
jgi:hypothetical protein